MVRIPSILYILTWKCISHYNGVYFFDIRTSKSGKIYFAPQRHALFNILTSKSGPKMVCFIYFDLEMYFALERRVLFRHRNFQKWSDTEVF